jgi:hypothetical protein
MRFRLATAKFRLGQFGQPEVEHLGIAVRPQHDVFRLDVAVNDTCRMSGFERARHLDGQLDYSVQRQFRRADVMAQSAAFDKFRGYEVAAVLLTKIIDSDYVRMVEGAGGAGFAFQPADTLRAVQARGQEFQGRLSPQACVVSEINGTHSAATQFPDEAIVADHLAAEIL